MGKRIKLPITEELDFAYLLSLLPPLKDEPEFAWLPELFSIVGHESLIRLCKYAGGETIKIPTLDELVDAIDALQLFYDAYLVHKRDPDSIPEGKRFIVNKIKAIYDADE